MLSWAVAGWMGLATSGLAWAGDVSIARERLAELEARARRVEALEAEVRRLEAELARARAPRPEGTGEGKARATTPSVVAPGWVPDAVVQSVAKAGPAPAVATRATEGGTVPVAHVLEHFAADAPSALARYQGVKLRFTGVVSDVDKPLFMAPYDVFFRRQDTPLRVRVRCAPPATATRVYVPQDRMTVVGEGGGRREVLARVGDAVEFEGTVKGIEGGVVEVRLQGTVKAAAP